MNDSHTCRRKGGVVSSTLVVRASVTTDQGYAPSHEKHGAAEKDDVTISAVQGLAWDR